MKAAQADTRAEIEKFEKFYSDLLLTDTVRGNRMLRVDIYWDKATGRTYQIEIGGPAYRFTKENPNDDVMEYGAWFTLTK